MVPTKLLDTFKNDDRRKLSFVCYLNEVGWLPENGGELVLYLDDNGNEVEKVIYDVFLKHNDFTK